jgi:hypothetical protein
MEIEKEMYHSDPACSASDDTFHQLTHCSLTHRTADGSKQTIRASKHWSLPATDVLHNLYSSLEGEDHMTNFNDQ